ncbi:nitrous oxide reductase family maturation protein NosD [Candidatus Binatus sp.]|uniref:nitrous oxide reductase family maturation protein NosD n=1 Tax=Candidatus Binatus sp. TaxID=2811406 RepID=UPI002F92A162
MLVVAPRMTAAAPPSEIDVCPSCPFSSLTVAVREAPAGSRIVVRGGIYHEHGITVNKPLEIVGQGWPVIDGGRVGETITVTSDDVRIGGLVVQNSGSAFASDPAGIKVKNSRRCVIERNRLLNDFFAIYLAASSECTVRDNEVRGDAVSEALSGNAIHLWNCRKIVVEGNRVSGHRDGLYFEFLHDSTIADNLSEHNLRYGMHTMFSADNSYRGNTLRDNSAGEVLMYSKRLVVSGNLIEHNWGAACDGALLKDLDESRIADNLFIRNSVGLYAEDSNRNRIERNKFLNNGIAVRVMADSIGNSFAANSFEANSFDVATNSLSTSENNFDGNYWSGYRGYDLNGDGIGDVPYHPVSLLAVLIENYPASVILLRSPFARMLELAETAIPVLTPKVLVDNRPLMWRPSWSKSATSKSASAR